LERAHLISKRREGRKRMVALQANTLKEADEYLEQYRSMWEGRFNKIDKLIKEGV
jgi:DNA-binding transcriptional ArsR family regulator